MSKLSKIITRLLTSRDKAYYKGFTDGLNRSNLSEDAKRREITSKFRGKKI